MQCTWFGVFLVLLAVPRAGAQRDEWCETEHDHSENGTEEELGHHEDFLVEIFHLYGDNATCRMLEEGFERLLSDLNIGLESHADHADEEDGHGHKRKRREVDSHCYGGEEILDVYNISHDAGMSQAQFESLSPALIQQIVQGCKTNDEEEHGDEEGSLSSAEKWGYGFLSVLIVTVCAVFGLIIVRWQQSPAYKYLMTLMLGLAVGTLTADALIHLVPHGLGLHNHSEDGHGHGHEDEGIVVDEFVWKMFLACLVIWLFFNIQILLLAFVKKPLSQDDQKVEPSPQDVSASNGKIKESAEKEQQVMGTRPTLPIEGVSLLLGNDLAGGRVIADPKVTSKPVTSLITKKLEEAIPGPVSLGWMIAIGDGVHNFTDGLAIAAAYNISWEVGLSSTIAIFCHETAHEFGDIAAMLSVGWSWKRVLLIQLLSQSTAFLGLFIGIPVAENSESAEQWILLLAAGIFLFVALSDIVPELMEIFTVYNQFLVVVAADVGILLGYGIMLVIAIFEEHIKV